MTHSSFRFRTRWLLPLLVLLLAGCGQRGPGATDTSSSTIPGLTERVAFLEQFVTFRRTFESLDFNIRYNDGSGMLPSPTEWDIRLVATVPESELNAWELSPALQASPDTDWIKAVPTTLDLSGVNEWFGDARRIVGIDRKRRIVAYRSWAD